MNQKKSNILSILSLIFGIIGLLLTCIFIGVFPAIVGVILGIVALTQKQSKGMAITGIVCGSISVLLVVVILAAVPEIDDEQLNDNSSIVSTQDDVEGSDLENEETDSSENVELRVPTIAEEVIYNSNNVVITVKGIEQDGKDYKVKLLIENNSELNLGFYAHAYGVNGIMSGESIYEMDCDVAAGKKANTFLEIESTFLKEYGIDEIQYIHLLLWAYDNDKSFKEFDTDQLLIETNLFSNQGDIPSGQVIYDDKGIIVEFMGRKNNQFTFMIINNTGSYFNFDFSEISVNDYTITEVDYDLYDEIVLCNNAAFCTVTVSDEFMNNNSIDKIQKIEFNLNCRPHGDYFEEYKVGTILYEEE